MSSFCARSIIGVATLLWLTAAAAGQSPPYGTPQLLPIPAGHSWQQAATHPSYHATSGSAAYQRGVEAWHPGQQLHTTSRVQEAPPVPPAEQYEIRPEADRDPYLAPRLGHGPGPLAPGLGLQGCDDCLTARSPWFGSVRGLLMTRDRGHELWLSFDTTHSTNRTLTTHDASMPWVGGVETRLGRYFHDGCFAIEGVYWGLYPADREANAFHEDVVGDLNTTFSFSSLEYQDDNGNGPLTYWFDDAKRHRLRRSWNIHNVEANLLRPLCCSSLCRTSHCGHGCGKHGGLQRPLRATWLAGVRYFRFDETFDFMGDINDFEFGNKPDSEVQYLIDLENHLVGGQIGGRLDYYYSQRLFLHSQAKFGVYANHIRQHQFAGGGNGPAWVEDPTSPNHGRLFEVRSTKDDVALLGELDLGLGYHLTPRWVATLGYRAVAVTGVALTPDQVPMYFDDLDGVAKINSSGSLILHGAYAGLEFNY